MVLSTLFPVYTSWCAQAFHVTFSDPDGRHSEAQVRHPFAIANGMYNLTYFWTHRDGLHCTGGLSVATGKVVQWCQVCDPQAGRSAGVGMSVGMHASVHVVLAASFYANVTHAPHAAFGMCVVVNVLFIRGVSESSPFTHTPFSVRSVNDL